MGATRMAAADSNTELAASSVVRQSDQQVAADLDGEVAMMSIENGEYYVLDPVASRTWELIEKPTKVADLCAKLVDEYDIEIADCQRDVLQFLGQMHGKGLIDVEAS
jgi:hypothetical protein